MVLDNDIVWLNGTDRHFEVQGHCLAVLERVRKTGKPVLVTRFGEPVAEVGPPPVANPRRRELGSMRGTARIVGDIVSPASDEHDWEVLRS